MNNFLISERRDDVQFTNSIVTFFFGSCFLTMARIFITGSSDGLGSMTAKLLADQGHRVVLHARNPERGRQALGKVPEAEKVLIGDLSSMDETKRLAEDVNAMGHFDAVIHNAGVYQVSNMLIFAVNTLAPYILTCLVQRPERLIYLSSGMHFACSAQPEAQNSDLNLSRKSDKIASLFSLIGISLEDFH
jgi:NAD(P)-dependent dehydrogenase (short-subunit alcohol dehydrogenase family)